VSKYKYNEGLIMLKPKDFAMDVSTGALIGTVGAAITHFGNVGHGLLAMGVGAFAGGIVNTYRPQAPEPKDDPKMGRQFKDVEKTYKDPR
jgi:hypothetical protein